MRAPEIRVFEGPDPLARGAAAEFGRRAQAAVRDRGEFAVALSGGRTPERLFRLLATGVAAGGSGPIPWKEIHFFWGDERAVPPDHPDSNYRSAREALFSRVPVPPDHLHRVRAEAGPASEVARDYEKELREFFRSSGEDPPRFDLIFLGMGTDGHTASLFPGSDAVFETRRLVVAPRAENVGSARITMTFPVLNRSRCVIFLVAGREKAKTIREVLDGELRPDRFPAQGVRPGAGDLFWFLDREAARDLPTSPGGGRGGRKETPPKFTAGGVLP